MLKTLRMRYTYGWYMIYLTAKQLLNLSLFSAINWIQWNQSFSIDSLTKLTHISYDYRSGGNDVYSTSKLNPLKASNSFFLFR